MPLEDKEQILNDIFKKVKESSSTIKSLFSMEKKQQKVSSNVIAQQEEKNSEEEVSRDEEKQYRIKTVKLLEEIRDNQSGEIGGAGGGGLGGLLGSLLGGIGGLGDLLVGSLTAGLGSLVGSMLLALPQLLAVAGVSVGAYKLGNWIYENGIQPWLDPLLDEQAKKAREQLNTTATSAIQATSDKGEKLYTDVKTGKTITTTTTTTPTTTMTRTMTMTTATIEQPQRQHHQHQTVRKENNTQYGDLPEFMDFEYLRKVACSNLATLSNLAWSPRAPLNIRIEVKDLTKFSTLVWNKPEGKSIYGYNILIRENSSPIWEKSIFVTDTNAEIPYSKDNYFFAVQSIDELGHASLPVFPIPIR